VVKKKALVVDSIKNIFYGYAGSFQRLSSGEFCQLYKTGGDSTLKMVFFDDSLEVTRTVEYTLNLYSGPGVIKQANDSTLLVLGQVTNPSTWDLVLINTDLQGNERWRTIFGEPGKDDYGFVIEQMNSKIIVSGNTQTLGPHIYDIDQMGNVTMQDLFDEILITKDDYTFGNVDETISSVLGKNERQFTLKGFGKALVKFLNFIDPNHALNSIEDNP
jgi:hypothetical protein